MLILRLSAALLACTIPVISAEFLLNGDFSSGLTGWTVANSGPGLGGQVSVVNGFGPVSGTAAFLETGPASEFGSPTPTFASLSQSFTLANDEDVTVSFDLTPLTARFTGAFAVELDRFVAQIVPASGRPSVLFDTDLSDPNFLLLPGAPLDSPSGGSYFEFLETQSFARSVSLMAGTYALEFRVESDGNSLFDSGLLVGNASVATDGVGAIPEPGTVVLLMSGMGILYAVRRTRGGTHA